MIELLASSFVLGVLFNAMPGAIFTESLRRGIRGGFWPAFAVQIGSLVGDLVWAVLGLAGAAALFALPVIDIPISVAGGLLLAWVASQALRDGLSPVPSFDPTGAARSSRTALMAGAALSIFEPDKRHLLDGPRRHCGCARRRPTGLETLLVFLMGFMGASLLWCFFCAAAIGAARRYVGPRLWLTLNIGIALGLAYFAGAVLLSALSRASTLLTT